MTIEQARKVLNTWTPLGVNCESSGLGYTIFIETSNDIGAITCMTSRRKREELTTALQVIINNESTKEGDEARS